MRNVELKARLANPQHARATAEALAAKRLGAQHQVDTYFRCNRGRLKLRQTDGLSSQLVWYARPDAEGPKRSDYRLVPVANPETLKAALSAALGVGVVVEKQREVFLAGRVRIHLDRVAGLGEFLEFEAVLAEGEDESAGHAELDRLIEQFGVRPEDLVAGSYAELIGDQ